MKKIFEMNTLTNFLYSEIDIKIIFIDILSLMLL